MNFDPNTIRAHPEVFQAWLGGAKIQYEVYPGTWHTCFANPRWRTGTVYRVVPRNPEVLYTNLYGNYFGVKHYSTDDALTEQTKGGRLFKCIEVLPGE